MQDNEYDVVITGGGMGGLLCATILAREGMKVCVLEKNRQIGGCLQTFALQKKVLDACVHYIGGLGEGHTLHRIFQYAGIMNSLPLHDLDRKGFDHIIFGDEQEAYPLGTRENFVAGLLPHFPGKEAALNAYLKLIDYVSSSFPLYNLIDGDAANKMTVLSMELMSTLRDLAGDERLAQVLAGNNLLYAGVDGQTPFYVHAMSTEGYLHSVHKVVPGSSQIAKLLWREIQKHGGEVHRHAEVTKLHEKDGVLEYAMTADGRKWFGKNFISAVHPAVLFSITESKSLRPLFKERVKSLTPTPPGVMVNMVLRPGVIPYHARNVYWHPSGEALAHSTSHGIEWPDSQAIFYTEDEARPGFADTVTVLVYAPDETFATWTESENIEGIRRRRNDIYHSRKEAYADAVLAKTFRRFPELRDAVIARSTATPLTLRDYTGTPGGALYGPMKDASRPGRATLAVRTKIPNLFLTGQNVNMHGVMGVSITAVATCAELLGLEYLLRRIRTHS
jgi:all-trans-retinol 13,14-reductase